MAKEKVICGIQQVGIGVRDVAESWQWYKDHFGFLVKIFEDEGVAERMLPYTGGKPQPRLAMLAINIRGGGGFEIWQPKGRRLKYPAKQIQLGDTGIFACKIKCPDVDAAYRHFASMNDITLLHTPTTTPWMTRHFFVRDPWDNLFEIEEDGYVFVNKKLYTGGSNGVIIGVTDMNRSMAFYRTLLDYDAVVSDTTGVYADLEGVPGADKQVRRVVLGRSKPIAGPMCEVMGTSRLELVQVLCGVPAKIYEGRFWGDPGFIHLCFDVRNMDKVQEQAQALGHPFVCDSGGDFDMGEANGHFTYVEDPDGTLIEFVETFKVPIVKKLGIYLHLKKKDDHKPLCRFVTKALELMSD